jgi:hypothetical protein
MSNIETIIRAQIAEENAPVTAAQFAAFHKQTEFIFNLLQQQLISLDVTCGLLMERIIPEDGREAFKAEVKRRVLAVAEGMASQQQQAEKKVTRV